MSPQLGGPYFESAKVTAIIIIIYKTEQEECFIFKLQFWIFF